MAANKRKFWDERVRLKIRASQLINVLQDHALGIGKTELSLSRVRAIGILLKKVVPDLLSTRIEAEMTYRYVAQLPDVLSKEDWIKKYGDPRQLEHKPDTLQ